MILVEMSCGNYKCAEEQKIEKSTCNVDKMHYSILLDGLQMKAIHLCHPQKYLKNDELVVSQMHPPTLNDFPKNNQCCYHSSNKKLGYSKNCKKDSRKLD